jgi:hypothetical protein
MKIIICGNRTFKDYARIEKECTDIISKMQYDLEIPTSELEFVTDNAEGTNKTAILFAQKNNISIKYIEPQWNELNDLPITHNIYLKPSKNGKMYNTCAPANARTDICEYVRQSGDMAILIAFLCKGRNEETRDMMKKAKIAGNIEIHEVKYEKEN